MILTRYPPGILESDFFFHLSVKEKLREGPLDLRFQREDQGPFGNQQELINQTGEDFGPTEGRKERSLTPSS